MDRKDSRLSLQESLNLLRVEDPSPQDFRYMSTRPAWVPGCDLPWENTAVGADASMAHTATYGAHVYALAAAAVLRAVADGQGAPGATSAELGLHSIQGCFTSRGLADRPFVFDVARISAGRSFATYSVTARQPRDASSHGALSSGAFPRSDAARELGAVCFAALTTLKCPEETVMSVQPPSAQETHAAVLSSRPGDAWPTCPSVDIEWIKPLFPDPGIGTFPMLDMRKVDMTAHNSRLPPHERKELLLYRLLTPLPASDPSQHVLAHTFAADRNGLLMMINTFEYGWHLGTAATLSWSFYVHVDPREAVMEGDGWWVLEDSFERAGAGRGFIVGRVYRPDGLHVATAVQDGIARVTEKL